MLSEAVLDLMDEPVIIYADQILKHLNDLLNSMSNSSKDSLRSYVHNLYQTKFAPQREFEVMEPHAGTEDDFDLDLYIAAIDKIQFEHESHVGEEPTSVESTPAYSGSTIKTTGESQKLDTIEENSEAKHNGDHLTVTTVGITAGSRSGFSSRLLPSNYNGMGTPVSNKNYKK